MNIYTKVPRVLLCLSRATTQASRSLKWQNHGVKGSLLLAGLFGSPKTTTNTQEELPKLEEPDSRKLSREYLIKQASINTAEEIGTLVLQTALALIQAEKEYTEAIFALVVMMEYKLQVLDNKREEERIWDLILQGRDLLNRTKTKKRTLEMILVNSKNMLSTAAEVAYMTGAEFAGGIAGDRLYKIEQHLKHTQRETENAEIKLRNIETKTIEVEAEHANKAAEDISSSGQSEENDDGADGTKHNEDSKDHTDKSKNVSDVSKSDLVENNSFKNVDNELGVTKDLNDFEKLYSKDKSESLTDDIKYNDHSKSTDIDVDIADRSKPTDREHEDLKF